MSVEKALAHLKRYDKDHTVLFMDASTATVPLAARALGVEEAMIAKTLSFSTHDGCHLIVMAGDAKVDNRKYKDHFGFKARMLSPEQAELYTGHAVGGVCPFGVPKLIPIYLDGSLRRFSLIYPACGSSNSAIPLTPEELETISECRGWIDIAKEEIVSSI